MRVAVLAGGRSSEHDVSLSSAASVRRGIAEAGHEVIPVTIERAGAWTHDGETLALTPGGGLLGADAVFPVLHGPFGEDGTVQGLLELLDVPYVGAGVLASSLCMDKIVFKEVLAAAGLPQVASAAVREGRWRDEPDAVAARADGARHAGVRQARSAGLVGRDRQGVVGGGHGRGARGRVRARLAGDRRGVLGGNGGRVLGRRQRPARGLGAGRDRAPGGRVVRLRGEVHGRRDAAAGARAAAGRRARGGPPARRRHVRARRLRRARARRLLRRGRPRARQRAQHDARVHGHERVPEVVGGVGGAVSLALRSAARAGAGALRRANGRGHAF